MKHILTSFMVGLAGIHGLTMEASTRPKLMVGIIVDQLRTDYLDNLKDMFTTGGFRRLMDKGIYLKDVDFIVTPGDETSASAIIQTGAYPRVTGLTGSKIYDIDSKNHISVFTDPAYIGNFTDETYSPSALRVSTLTDEIAIEGKGKSKIHSIAPNPEEAIVLAGHAGNSAFWVNDESGRWSSTTYYTNPSTSIQNRNYNNPLISRIDTLSWTPLHKGEPYKDLTAQEIKDGFKYTYSRSDRDVFNLYKSSPFVNQDITEVATDYISEFNLGKNPEAIDVLNIGYTLSPYPLANTENYKFPLQDAYLRLDKNLETLFNALDKQVGKDNVLVYLISTGYFAEPGNDNSTYKIPGGTVSVKRSMSLLNAYLAAKYGNGAYVDRYTKDQIYLDKKVLEEKNLDLNRVAEDARDFLIKMSGISDAYTSSDLMSPALASLEAHHLAMDPKTSGDILLEFNPGWTIIDDSVYPPQTKINKTTAYLFPGFIMAPEITPKTVEEKIEASEIAPTLANTLRIRAPNSSVSKPLKINNLK